MIPAVSIVHNKTPIDDITFRFLLQFSPPEKQQRILRQRVKQNADSMVSGGALARYMLWKEFCIPWDAHIAYGEFGKPYLSDYPDVHFNISHSGQYVVCAVCNRPVGVDVQEIAPYQPDVAAKVCSNVELSQIEASGNQAAEFTKAWTIKEAYLKMLGLGLGHELQAMEVPPYMNVQAKKYISAFVSIVKKELDYLI
ncbi:MAG: 4'-phosphopantetheinyl transferase superfamily protein [Oscillospiraceae bacterium]|nr:4'-phosphopantetheinyl transferase superfamily protein [Oscillospiraceae bacterium]